MNECLVLDADVTACGQPIRRDVGVRYTEYVSACECRECRVTFDVYLERGWYDVDPSGRPLKEKPPKSAKQLEYEADRDVARLTELKAQVRAELEAGP